jgi:chemotaxis protein histidine kinase CheA
VHSLKGSALMLQLKDIAQVAHSLEDLFVAAQCDAAILRPSTFDAVLGALDVLTLRVEQVERGASIPAAVEPLCEALASLAAGPAGTDTGPADTNRTVAHPQGPAAAASWRGAAAPSLRVPTEKLDALSGLAAELVLHELKVSERLGYLRRLETSLRQFKAAMSDARSDVHEDGTHPAAEPLDAFANLLRGMRQLVNRYDDDHVRLKLMTGEVRQHVMALTLVPVSTVFEAFPRAVRDLARAFKTEVNLSITGGDTEIDKKIIDQIADPLIHLLRNAMDHGIEPARERIALGKAQAAQLRISAEHRGNRIVITIEDDGRGIDLEKIRASAVRLGIARARNWKLVGTGDHGSDLQARLQHPCVRDRRLGSRRRHGRRPPCAHATGRNRPRPVAAPGTARRSCSIFPCPWRCSAWCCACAGGERSRFRRRRCGASCIFMTGTWCSRRTARRPKWPA